MVLVLVLFQTWSPPEIARMRPFAARMFCVRQRGTSQKSGKGREALDEYAYTPIGP